MAPPRTSPKDVLYRFHEELSASAAGTEELLAAALGLVSSHIEVDRLSVFFRADKEMLLEERLCMFRGLRQEMEGEIHLVESSTLGQLVEGRRGPVGFLSPHPILYVPLRTQPSGDGQARGLLRLERLGGGGRRPRTFSRAERDLACRFARELARSLQQVEVVRDGLERSKRLEALTELTAIFASSLRVEDGLKLILQGIQNHFTLDRARLYLVDRQAKQLRGELSVDMRGQVKSLRAEELPLEPGSHRFVDMVLKGEREPSAQRYNETVLHIPLTVQGQSIGLLIVDNMTSQEPIPGEDVGLLRSFAGQIALAVDNSRLFDEVQALSLYDSLTGLPVRRFFFQRFQEEVYRAQRFGQPLALAIMDLDYYKEVNDTYGHQVGDQVLKEVGRVIMANLRKIDFPCRYGGDELLVLLPQSRVEDARVIMTRLAQQIREVRIPVPFSKAREISVTASIGLAHYPDDGRTVEDLVARADEALYWVKSHGKDKVASFEETKEPTHEP